MSGMIWSGLYRKPLALTGETGQRRIYSPSAYAVVRDIPVVPIVMSEAARLAAYHPICWKRRPEEDRPAYDLVVLRTLLEDGRGQPVESARANAALPMLLQAFPLVAGARGAHPATLIEDAFADSPRDAGAPILGIDGRPSRAAQQRMAIVKGFAREAEVTEGLSLLLEEAGLMEPWPLQFELGGGMRISREDLFVVDFAALRAAKGRVLRHSLGLSGLRFLMLHRISLFRVSALLTAARRQIAEQATRTAAPDRRLDQVMAVLA